MSRFISVWSSELGDQNAEDINEKHKVGQNAGQSRGHINPLNV